MIIIPAIDIKDGNVVRLRRGDFLDVEVYSDDPVAMAKKWQDAGAPLLHIVDLDGARTGKLENLSSIAKIAQNVTIPIEVGGGIRERTAIETVLDAGARSVVLGTRALDPQFLANVVEEFGDSVIVSVDAKGGIVAIKGWQQLGGLDAVTFARDLQAKDIKRIIYTDVLKDGMLGGPNFSAIEKLLDAVSVEVIASGGISSLEDLRKLKQYESKGLTGVIVGKAIYENKLDLQEAIVELSKQL